MFWNDKKRVEQLSLQIKALHEQNDAMNMKLNDLFHEVKQAIARPRGIELLKKLGVKPERFLERYFEEQPDNALYEALYGGSAALSLEPGNLRLPSSLCRQIHFSTDEFRHWMQRMARLPRMHRKDWEWFYIAQCLFERGMLVKGKRGLGFAVGQEPLPALFASLGCEIVATDQAPEDAIASGWGTTNMYSHHVDALFNPNICTQEQFSSVSFEYADMNNIPDHYIGMFDFCWSSCAFEHLGSIELGLKFVENSINALASGGIAVHTTEFNLTSNEDTMETPGCSIYRRRDMEELANRLEKEGHKVEPFDWSEGNGFSETVIDLPPYRQSPHLKLRIAEYNCTSIGIIVRKR